jgi:hypothetical protein
MEITVSQAMMGQLLVDVDALRDQIKGLSAELAEPLQAIADATQSGRTAVESHVVDKKNELKELSQKERVIMEQRLMDAVNKAAQDLEKAGQRMAWEIGRPEGLPGWVQIAFAFGIGVVASVTSIYGAYKMFGNEQKSQAEMGRAVMEAWPELDEKAKVLIEKNY